MTLPAASTRGPGISPRAMPSRSAKIASLSSPRLATVVNPACSVFAAKPAPLIAQSAVVRTVLVAQVDVAVDEAGQHESLAEVDDRPALTQVAGLNLRDATVAHDDRLLRRDPAGRRIGEQPASVDQHSRRGAGTDPRVDVLLEDRQRHRPAAEYDCVERFQVEAIAERGACALAQLDDLEHADGIRCRLARHHDVALDFALIVVVRAGGVV